MWECSTCVAMDVARQAGLVGRVDGWFPVLILGPPNGVFVLAGTLGLLYVVAP